MNKKIRTIGLGLVISLWAVLTLSLWLVPRQDYSYSERRKLAQFPEISVSSLFSGNFMADFEDFTLDQFPLREDWRKVKSLFHYNVLNQADNNGIYLVGDTVAKIEYPLNEPSVSYAAGRLHYLYETYLKDTDCKIYASVVPDKGFYLAQENGYPALDYGTLIDLFRQGTSWAEYVDITGLLEADDYYRTDTHWRQEHLLDVAQTLCSAMGAELPQTQDFTPVQLEQPFYGVYYGQAALPMEPEEMVILRSPVLAGCRVFDYLTGEFTDVYNMEKLSSPDLYDVYLSGAQPILSIDNHNAAADRELVIFRDSYGSSLAPMLVQGYKTVTLIDIRYISPDQLGHYLTFRDQDVLFLYSTLILNNGRSLK